MEEFDSFTKHKTQIWLSAGDEEEIVHSLNESWRSQAYSLSSVHIDSLAKSYLINIIGLEQDKVDDFIESRHHWDFVGKRHAGINPMKGDYRAFWEDVRRVCPGFSPLDLEWLIEKEDISGVYAFMSTLSFYKGSRILGIINVNAHAYK